MKLKYLCIGYSDKAKMNALSKEELDSIMSKCGTIIQKLYRNRQFVLDAGLDTASPGKTVRTVGGRLSITDGPFVETKEQLGTVFIVEAEDLSEAAEIASLHPTAQFGEELGWAIEIHPIGFFKQG